jgi:Cu/Ag efflux protein CusF
MKKTLMSLMAALVAVAVLVGAGLAQAPKAASPSAPAPTTQAPAKAPVVKTITGEFVTMDKTAKTVTVKYLADKKPTQMILNVDDTMLSSLAQLKAGDQVKVSYEEMGGKFIAKTIAKA